MPINASRDNNVPFLPNRSRYSILGETPTLVSQTMGAGVAFTGVAPTTATTVADATDPTVSAGKAAYANLTAGGLFRLLGNYGKAMVVESAVLGAATMVISDYSGVLVRPAPATYPFKVAPGEYLKVTGGGNGATASVLVRLDVSKIG